MSSNDLVLVTGGSGFIGSHCILALLRAGYRVRTTVRSLKRADEVRSMVQAGGVTDEQAKSIEFCEADLSDDKGWPKACKDCTYVLHVASPFPAAAPKHEDELIIPAREGTLRALKAAKAAGTVKRVVVTGSMAAIAYGHEPTERPFTEKTWTNLDNPTFPVSAYAKSKTLAERAAWDWIESEGGEMGLTVINPVGVFGPVLGKDFATSVIAISRLMNGEMPGLPNLGFNIVDVRDVADLHLRAMTDPKANGERFLAVSGNGFMWMKDMALTLKDQLGEKAKNVPTRTVPNFVIRIVGLWDPTVKLIAPDLSKVKNCSNEKAKTVLGWKPRSMQDAIVSSGESLYEFGLVKK